MIRQTVILLVGMCAGVVVGASCGPDTMLLVEPPPLPPPPINHRVTPSPRVPHGRYLFASSGGAQEGV